MTEEPKKETPAPAARPHFLEKPAIRGLLAVSALAAPGPLMLALTDLWLGCCAPDEMKKVDPFTVLKQSIEGAGDAPGWLPVVAFLLPVILLVVMHRKSGPALLVLLLALIGTTAAEVFLLMQMTQS